MSQLRQLSPQTCFPAALPVLDYISRCHASFHPVLQPYMYVCLAASVYVCVCPEGRTWLAESVPDVVLEVKEGKRGQRLGPVKS